ncbi:hypothetical protein ABEB36_002389 [Hypothenemus hampei]|uniref:Cyclic nucleotide-binding domain-containing protein n=1 Tax=Hypothenemus hampei TaxID=57062 RepID=A0ABD1F5J8_HYPHA
MNDFYWFPHIPILNILHKTNNIGILSGISGQQNPNSIFFSFFKVSAETFGITINKFQDHVNWEDILIAAVNYITGKQSNITLLGNLSEDEICVISEYLIIEVYSSNDIIIYSDTKGDSLFLLALASVAVYNQSCKEVCHLHDGDISVNCCCSLEHRVTTTNHCNRNDCNDFHQSENYRIAKIYFEKYILSKKGLHAIFMKPAEKRLQAIKKAEADYRMKLFAEIYKN